MQEIVGVEARGRRSYASCEIRRLIVVSGKQIGRSRERANRPPRRQRPGRHILRSGGSGVVSSAIFLASDDSFVNGIEFFVDSGQAQISRVERQDDMLISTFASYLKAFGTRRELRPVDTANPRTSTPIS
jgi:hypothetical protein